MTSERFVVDVDAHYTEAMDELEEYYDDDDPWKRRMRPEALYGEKLTGSVFPDITNTYINFKRDRIDARTKEDIIDIMEFLGIDAIIMISNLALLFPLMDADDQRQVKFTETYIEYMLDRIVDPDEGIYMAIPIPHQAPSMAVERIEEVKNESGVVGAVFSSGMPEPPMGNRKYDPIYDAAQDADLPIIFHGVGGAMDHFVKGFTSPIAGRHLQFLWGNTAQLTSIILNGIPEKFPDLDFVFQECGIFWVPMMMYRLDGEYLKAEWDAPLLEKLPSEYMKEMYYGTQPMEEPPTNTYFEYVIEMMGGADCLMYASDYPHVDYDAPSAITDLPFLSTEEKHKILGGNARVVFDL